MWQHNMWNSWVNGLRVPYGYVVDLYPTDGFAGDPLTIKGGIPGENDEARCISLKDYGFDGLV